MLIRTSAGCCAAALVLLAAGCGGDEEEQTAGSEAPTAPVVTTDRGATAELPDEDTATATDAAPRDPATSPEDQPGGAGDEEPARSEVVLEFSSEGLSPTEVRVAPFIPVELIVRSDGTEYDLTYTAPRGGGGANGTTEADFEIDGLRPDEEIVVRERNTGSTVRILPAHEPGP